MQNSKNEEDTLPQVLMMTNNTHQHFKYFLLFPHPWRLDSSNLQCLIQIQKQRLGKYLLWGCESCGNISNASGITARRICPFCQNYYEEWNVFCLARKHITGCGQEVRVIGIQSQPVSSIWLSSLWIYMGSEGMVVNKTYGALLVWGETVLSRSR